MLWVWLSSLCLVWWPWAAGVAVVSTDRIFDLVLPSAVYVYYSLLNFLGTFTELLSIDILLTVLMGEPADLSCNLDGRVADFMLLMEL